MGSAQIPSCGISLIIGFQSEDNPVSPTPFSKPILNPIDELTLDPSWSNFLDQPVGEDQEFLKTSQGPAQSPLPKLWSFQQLLNVKWIEKENK